jgi:predicted peptidase
MKFIVLVLMLFFSGELMFSQEVELMNKFESRSHIMGSTTIPYRIFIPENKESKLPLVIALHGAGERGDDNSKQIEFHRLGTVWVDGVNEKEHPCFVVAPQCPKEKKWVNIDWGNEKYDFKNTKISDELATVVDLIDSLIENYNIDENRIYVTGLSMGGYGSWYLLMNNPKRFAAAIIMSGTADPQMACEIKDIPVWDFHGDLDNAVPVEGSRNIIKAISDCGKDILLISNPNKKSFLNSEFRINRAINSEHIYTEYAGKGHVIWKESYNNKVVRDWLFSKKRK